MRVYLIRHGESEANQTKQWTGWLDAKLSDKGIEQAKAIRPFFENVKFDKVYSSDLCRAYVTAKTVLPEYEPEQLALIREFNVGSLSGQTHDAVDLHDPKYNFATNGFLAFGGESNEQFAARSKQFIRSLEESNYETVAVFSHGGFMRRFLGTALDVAIPPTKITCLNCAIMVLDFNGEIWNLAGLINPYDKEESSTMAMLR